VNPCVILRRVSELGCWALIVFAFESISVRRQVGYLTMPFGPTRGPNVNYVSVLKFWIGGIPKRNI